MAWFLVGTEPVQDVASPSSKVRAGSLPIKNTFVHFETELAPADATALPSRRRPGRFATAPVAAQVMNYETNLTTLVRPRSSTAPAELAHRLGRCQPCAYHVFKSDGCRQGDSCAFCHLCTADEIKQKRRMQLKLLKSAKREAAVARALSNSDSAGACHVNAGSSRTSSPALDSSPESSQRGGSRQPSEAATKTGKNIINLSDWIEPPQPKNIEFNYCSPPSTLSVPMCTVQTVQMVVIPCIP